LKHADSDKVITAIVIRFTFNGFGGSPASNEGYITIKPNDATQEPYVLRLGGPDDKADLPLEIAEYMRRVNAIYGSYNLGTSIMIKIRYGDSLPVIVDIT
jgi:hypothetical protein